MNISNIKTKTELYDFTDIWYQRTKNLMSYLQDLNNPPQKRLKALFLWKIMFERMQKIIQIVIELEKPIRPIGNYCKSAGIVGESSTEEIIIPPTPPKGRKIFPG